MATNSNPPCKNCEKGGLPILPVRYTVLPKTVSAKLPEGITGESVTSVALTEHNYGLRTLREGWLYLFYTKGPRGKNYWEAYRVTEDGRLWKQAMPLPAVPVTHPACAKSGHAVPMDIIAIEQPETCDKVYLAFSEHAWHQKIFDMYADAKNASLREQRMQCIEPAKWVTGSTNKHAAVATEKSIDTVVEYMPGFNPTLLQPSTTQKLSDETGKYDPQLLKREATRYPLHVRQATPDSASAQLVDMMHTIGKISAARYYPPMVFALTDAIGNVHELNGFRNDANSMLSTYVRERAVQVDAMLSIDRAKTAVQNGAVAFKSYLRTVNASIANAQNLGGGMAITFPSGNDVTEAITNIKAAGEISPTEAKAIGQAEWPKYLKKLNPSKLPVFRPWFASVQIAVAGIQANRSADVGAWLKANLLLTTLHDYYEEDMGDGKAFDAVVSEAISGLASEEKGEKLVSDLVDNMDPTQPASLVWRAFVGNQKQAKIDIKKFLKQMTDYKSTTMENVAEWSEKIAGPLEYLKSFDEYWEKMKEVAKHPTPVSATEKVLKALKIDRLVTAIGPSLFKWTGQGVLGDRAGSFLLRAALWRRGGVSQADAISLLKQSVMVEPIMHMKLQAEFMALRLQGAPVPKAYGHALESLASDEGGQLLRAKWNAVKLSAPEGEAVGNVRFSGALAIIEVISFSSALAKTSASGEGYAPLFASGLSATSACLQVSTKALTELSKDAATTLANLKGITGCLSGATSLITAFVDAKAGQESGKKGNIVTSTLFFIKALIDLGAATASVLSALTSGAPFIARVVGPKGVAFLGRLGDNIATLTARAGEAGTTEVAGEAVTKVAAAAAAEEVTEVVVVGGERGLLMVVARGVVILGGWEVVVLALFAQFLIWYFSDNDLQEWFAYCWFGKSPKNPPWPLNKQHEEFEKSLKSTGLKSSEDAE